MKRRVNKAPELTGEQKEELASLAATPEKDVDTIDIAELTAEDFARALRLHDLYKPRKKQITARIDADVLLWLKSKGGLGYQSRLNAILREAMTYDTGVGTSGTTKQTSKRSQAAPKGSR